MKSCKFCMLSVFALLAAVAVWSFSGAGTAIAGDTHDHDHDHATVGKAAPDFELKDTDGETHKLSELKGKIVVLEWTNHQCPFVVRHQAKKKTMQHTFAKFDDKDVVWLAIDSSHFCEKKAGEIKKWREKQDIEYPILLDASGKVGHLYQARTTPHMFVIDRKGILAYQGAIDDDPYGKSSEARNYVEEAVNSLLADSTVATSSSKPYGCSVKYKR